MHHSYGDGLAVLSYLLNIGKTNNYQIVNLKKTSKFVIFLNFFLLFFVSLKIMAKEFFRKFDRNDFFLQKEGITYGKKTVAMSKSFNLLKLKEFAKKQNISINDLFVFLIGNTLQTYAESYLKTIPENVLMLIPISARGFPKPNENYKLKNETVPYMLEVPFIKSEKKLSELLQIYKDHIQKNRFSPSLFVAHYYFQILNYLFPPFVLRKLTLHYGKKPTCLFSNLPGTLSDLFIYDCKVENFFFFVNFVTKLPMIFGLMSCKDKLMLTCSSDKSYQFEPQIFVKLFEEKVDKFIN